MSGAMNLAPDYLDYRLLRRSTDCILAYQVGKAFEFHGDDALTVAGMFGLPIGSRWTDAKGQPVPMCEVGIAVKETIEGDKLTKVYSFDPELHEALSEAGYPLALAVKRRGEDGATGHEIVITYRPQLSRPQLRLVD